MKSFLVTHLNRDKIKINYLIHLKISIYFLYFRSLIKNIFISYITDQRYY